jgi:hypothetical protein
MNTNQRPYELLIRWNQKGQLAGAHVQYRYVIEDESGSVIGDVPGSAMPLTIGEFPLSDLLNQAQADALAKVEALKQESIEREREHQAQIESLTKEYADALEALRQAIAANPAVKITVDLPSTSDAAASAP